MSERLTRKEIKRQDSFQTAMTSSLELVQRYRRELVLGAVLLVLAVVALVAWSFWTSSREDDAQVLLAEAIEVYGAPVGDEARAAGDGPVFASEEERRTRAAELFREVEERYGSSAAAAVARAYRGGIAAAEGDVETARRLWREYLDDQEDTMLAAEVRLNLIHLDRASGRSEEVAARLEEMLLAESRPLPGDIVLHELAQTLEQLGREEEAAERWQQLVTDYPASPYAAAARQRTGGGFPGLQNLQLPS